MGFFSFLKTQHTIYQCCKQTKEEQWRKAYWEDRDANRRYWEERERAEKEAQEEKERQAYQKQEEMRKAQEKKIQQTSTKTNNTYSGQYQQNANHSHTDSPKKVTIKRNFYDEQETIRREKEHERQWQQEEANRRQQAREQKRREHDEKVREEYRRWEEAQQETSRRHHEEAQRQFESDIEDLRNADKESAKVLFRKLVKTHHPDIGGDPERCKTIFNIFYNKKKRWE